MLERLRLFRDRDRDKSRDRSCSPAADSKPRPEKIQTIEVVKRHSSSNDGRRKESSNSKLTALAATKAQTTTAAASATPTATNGGYQLSEQLRERIQRRVQFSTSSSATTASTTTTTTHSGSVVSTNERYSELLSKLERRQRLSSSGQQRRYEGSDSGGSSSPYSRLRLLGLSGNTTSRQTDSADEAGYVRSRYRSGGVYGSGGYASDGYTSEYGGYYGVVANSARQPQQQQQQQEQQQQNSLTSQQHRQQQQQQARYRRRCYGSADECDDDVAVANAAAAAAEAAEAAAAASQCRLRATGAALCLSDVESTSPDGGSLLRQRRSVSRQQQRCSDSMSDNEASNSRASTASSHRWRALESVHLPYPGGTSAGRFASLERGCTSASLLSPTSAAAATAASERRSREIRQLRRELAEARQRASSLAAALNANASAVSAFERRLGGASFKLRELASTAQRGDAEIDQLRAAIEQLRSGSVHGSDTSTEVINLLDMPIGTGDSVMLTVAVDVGNCGRSEFNDQLIPIGRLRVGTSAAWSDVVSAGRRILREFAVRIDPPGGLGLGADSIAACRLVGCGDMHDIDLMAATATGATPYRQLLNFSGSRPLRLILVLRSFDTVSESSGVRHSGTTSGLDALAFVTLVPKAVLQRYVCLLAEHRRLVLCGPTGTGKTYLARHLARHMARLEGGGTDASDGVADFSGESRRSEQELRAFLAEAALSQAAGPDKSPVQSKRSSPPRRVRVLLLDSLQHLAPLAEARSGLAASKLYIICTLRRGLRQLQALDDGGGEVGFRWLLCANHLEPVRGLLGRYLRRQKLSAEAANAAAAESASRSNAALRRHPPLDDWLPGAWQRVNAFLELRGGGPDATLGPGPLLRCPLDQAAARDWFVSLWNHSLAPRLLAAAAAVSATATASTASDWEDPADWVLTTWPWPELPPADGELIRLRRAQPAPADPLMAMLMKLREAAAAAGARGDADAV